MDSWANLRFSYTFLIKKILETKIFFGRSRKNIFSDIFELFQDFFRFWKILFYYWKKYTKIQNLVRNPKIILRKSYDHLKYTKTLKNQLFSQILRYLRTVLGITALNCRSLGPISIGVCFPREITCILLGVANSVFFEPLDFMCLWLALSRK